MNIPARVRSPVTAVLCERTFQRLALSCGKLTARRFDGVVSWAPMTPVRTETCTASPRSRCALLGGASQQHPLPHKAASSTRPQQLREEHARAGVFQLGEERGTSCR